jgi:hypothetical protein
MGYHPLALKTGFMKGRENTNALPNIPRKKSQDYHNLHNGCKSHETAFVIRDT